jgi:hypothetical protein
MPLRHWHWYYWHWHYYAIIDAIDALLHYIIDWHDIDIISADTPLLTLHCCWFHYLADDYYYAIIYWFWLMTLRHWAPLHISHCHCDTPLLLHADIITTLLLLLRHAISYIDIDISWSIEIISILTLLFHYATLAIDITPLLLLTLLLIRHYCRH